jgi:energy-coupling factor transporter ATP-binding protein EcfA2
MLDVFGRFGGELLILGAAGSGKTTTLLQLARDLLDRAEEVETVRIPVVFRLLSWTVEQQPFEDWLLCVFRKYYSIPEAIASNWIETNALVILLDGLDEVDAGVRDACVRAINAFRDRHLIPMAVSSRTATYEAMTNKLNFQGAIRLRSLTESQIETYLAGAGTELQAVRATLRHDAILQEMARTPLFLSIMTRSYRGLTLDTLKDLDTRYARRQRIFDTYIQQMLRRHLLTFSASDAQTLRWLVWLAKQWIFISRTC